MESLSWCNMTLLKSSLGYHGPQLLDELKVEQQFDACHMELVASSNCSSSTRDEFSQRLVKFIARKADLLFAKDTSCRRHWPTNDLNAENHYAILPPLEHFMDVPKSHRYEHFWNGVERGSVVIGMVTCVQETGLLLTVLTTEIGRVRDLNQLKITAFCPLREIPKTHNHDNVLESYSNTDKVRAIVLSIQDDRLIVSMQPRNLSPSVDIQLGLVSDDDLPLHYRRLQESLSSGGKTYESYLDQVLEYHNPSNVSNLLSMFDIRDDCKQPSLMRGLYRVKYNEEDFADKLRKGQSYRVAMRSVGDGVKHFKQGQHLEAMQLFNRSLQIDPENVEALVARGALYANCESYRRAIDDFEEAIRLNPSHANAKKYLHQTLTAFAYDLMDKDTESASSYVRRALDLNPKNEETITLMNQIQKRLEPDRKVSPSGSESGQDVDENQAVIDRAKATLLRMIQEEQGVRCHADSLQIQNRSKSISSEVGESREKRERIPDSNYSEDSFVLADHRVGLPSHASLEGRNGEHHSVKRYRRQSLYSTTAGGSPSSESNEFSKVMTTDHNKGSCIRKNETVAPTESLEVYGPALPPTLLTKNVNRLKRKRCSRSSSSSSSTSSSSRSTAGSTSSSSSSSTSLTSAHHSTEKASKKHMKSSSDKKRIRLKSPRHETSFRQKSGSSKVSEKYDSREGTLSKSGRKADSYSSRKRQSRQARNRSSSERSQESRKPCVSLSSEKRKRSRVNEDPSCSVKDVTKRKSIENVKTCSSASKSSLINYSLSSDEDSGLKRTAVGNKSTEPKGSIKYTDPKKSSGETLQDLEQFLQELKSKKKTG